MVVNFVIFVDSKTNSHTSNITLSKLLLLIVSEINAAIPSPLHLVAQLGTGLTSYHFRHGGKKNNIQLMQFSLTVNK